MKCSYCEKSTEKDLSFLADHLVRRWKYKRSWFALFQCPKCNAWYEHTYTGTERHGCGPQRIIKVDDAYVQLNYQYDPKAKSTDELLAELEKSGVPVIDYRKKKSK